MWSCSERALKALTDGRILHEGETPEDMLGRIVGMFASMEVSLGGDPGLARDLADHLYRKRFVPSTPILMNAGRPVQRPLSACCVPPVSLKSPLHQIKAVIDQYHEDGMGTGFDLNEVDDPVSMVLYLNDVAVEGLARGNQRRPVGNMGVLRVSHSRIREFVRLKRDRGDVDWKFNLSVDVSDEFMRLVREGGQLQLDDGTRVSAAGLFAEIVEAAHACGDPGLVFLDRMNARNPLSRKSRYVSTAPCGEMGLARGEACQFLSLNLREFAAPGGIDIECLRRAVPLAVRFLDDALEQSIRTYASHESRQAMLYGRRIGLGVCGFSDLLLRAEVEYGSARSRELLAEALSVVNAESKRASMELAEERGSFGGFAESGYYVDGDFLQRKFGALDTRFVRSRHWRELDLELRRRGMRNASTVVLPPTGRCSLVFDTSQQIEPLFSLCDSSGRPHPELVKHLIERYSPTEALAALDVARRDGSLREAAGVSPETRGLFATAIEIPHETHLALLRVAQHYSDDAVSKTVNLPAAATAADVLEIYSAAHESWLCGITVYRDGCSPKQPLRLH